MEFRAALDTICNASDDCLHSHATETISVLRRLSERLQHNLLPTSPISQAILRDPPSVPSPPQSPQYPQVAGFLNHQAVPRDTPSVPSPQSPRTAGSLGFHLSEPDDARRSQRCLPTSGLQASAHSFASPSGPSIPARHPPTDHVPDLLKRVKQSAQWLRELSQRDMRDILSRKRNSDEDPRWDHIRRVVGDRSISNEAKLMRILALRSIALQFTNEQMVSEKRPTKLDDLCEHALLLRPSNDPVFKYDKKDFSSASLSTGLKHMVTERVIANQQCDLPQNYTAISALVGLHIDSFRRFRYNEMLNFARNLLSEDLYDPILQKDTNLLDYVRQLSVWFNQLQILYDLIYKPSRITSNSTASAPDSGNPPTDLPDNGAETRNPGDFTVPQFADLLYEQISTQPYDVSGIMDDIATRSCLDFDSISPQPTFGLAV